jgi:hypothetical protein
VTLFVVPTLPEITAAYGIVWTFQSATGRSSLKPPCREDPGKIIKRILRERHWAQAGRHI